MATSIATHYALEIHELRDQVHACENAFNGDLHSIIDKVEDEYLNEIDVHDEIQKKLDKRLALIDQLEVIYGDLGEDSEEPVIHAAYNRRVRKRAGEIANIHDEIAKLAEKDEELRNLAAWYVLSIHDCGILRCDSKLIVTQPRPRESRVQRVGSWKHPGRSGRVRDAEDNEPRTQRSVA